MRTFCVRFLSVVVATLVTAFPADAQNRFGLGLGLQHSSVLAEGIGAVIQLTPQVYLPIMLTDRIMVEPGVGYFRTSTSSDSEFGNAEEQISVLQTSAALLFVIAPAEQGRLYAGPRLGIIALSSHEEFSGGGPSDFERTDLVFSGLVGGEYFLLPSFSVGGEASLNYARMGDAETEPSTSTEREGSILNIGTELRVRWYVR